MSNLLITLSFVLSGGFLTTAFCPRLPFLGRTATWLSGPAMGLALGETIAQDPAAPAGAAVIMLACGLPAGILVAATFDHMAVTL